MTGRESYSRHGGMVPSMQMEALNHTEINQRGEDWSDWPPVPIRKDV